MMTMMFGWDVGVDVTGTGRTVRPRVRSARTPAVE
jgi:hypothetical protein